MNEHNLCWNVTGVLATTIRLVLHYVAMLFAMTYSVGIFISICVGGGFGFLLIKGYHSECLKSDAVKPLMIEQRDQEPSVATDSVFAPDGACC
jgi:hypothetical protein